MGIGIAGAILGGSALSAAGGLLGSAVQNYFDRDAAENANTWAADAATTAFERSKEYYQNRYQWAIKDMKASGLNPILAATGGYATGSAPVISQAQTFKAQPGMPNMGSATASAKDLQETATEIERRELISNQAATELQKAAKVRAEKGLITQQEREMVERVWKTTAEFKLTMKNAYKAIAERELTEAQIKNIKVQTERLLLEMSELARTSEVYKSSFGKYLKWINEVRQSFGINISGVGAATKLIK